MKKILLSAGMLFLAFAAQAQCTAVATLNENFDGFTAATGFPQNCWNKITTGPVVYLTGTTNIAATFYASMAATVPAYIVSPELSTIDGKHQLSFTAALSPGSIANGVATLQVGTLSAVGDASTFVAVGAPIAISSTTATSIPAIVIPASTTQKFIAFQITGSLNHTAALIDNVVYEAVPACEAVATIKEDFSDFTLANPTSFPQNCWNSIGYSATGPWIYTEQTTDKANQYAVYYTHMTGANVAGYFVTPELSVLDGKHQVSFDTFKVSRNGAFIPGNITVQVGTLTSLTDAASFEAVGTPVVVTETSTPSPKIVIPASTTKKYIAFKFLADAQFNAAALDNVVYEAIPAPACEAVATLDENFDTFDATAGFAQNCWSKIAASDNPRTNSMVYLKKTEANVEAIYYSNTGITETPLLITPEISNIDGKNALTFDAYKTIPGNVTVQLGTLSDATDASTFVAVGNPINLVAASTVAGENTYSNIVFPASATQKYVAFKFSTDTEHSSARLDNIKWKTATTAGVNDFAKNKFSIFPNPSSTKNVTIAYTGTDKANVTVYSVTGAKVFETVINGTNANLNLSSLSSGMYIVKLSTGNGTATQKLVIQ